MVDEGRVGFCGVVTGRYYVSNTNDLLPAAYYTFGADGKMLQGIVEKNGTLYYYENGVTGTHGMINYNGDYYYVYWGGKLIVNRTFYVSETNGYTIRMNYTFDEYGRVIL